MKSDILKAVIFAVLAASLLGMGTYYVSTQVVTERRLAVTLDTFTQKGGQGSAIVSDPYLYNESISIYALMKDESHVPLTNASIAFQISGPLNPILNVTFKQTTTTNASGIAVLDLTIPFQKSSPETVVGIWTVVATTLITDEEEVVDTLVFEVQPPTPYVDVFTDRGGLGPNLPSELYIPNETVTLYALVSDGVDPSSNSYVAFTVFNTNATEAPVIARAQPSNNSGVASISFRLHPDVAISGGKWQVLVSVMIKSQVYGDTLTFNCAP